MISHEYPELELDYLDLKLELAALLARHLVNFDHVYLDEQGNNYLQTDLETGNLVIGITMLSSGADDEMSRYIKVSDGRQVVLIAPNYADAQSMKFLIEELGVKILFNRDEFLRYFDEA